MIIIFAALIVFFFFISEKFKTIKINKNGDNILKMSCRKVKVLEENTQNRSYQKSMKISNNLDNTADVDIHNVEIILQEIWVKDKETGDEEKLTFRNKGIDIRKDHELSLYYIDNDVEYIKNVTFKNRLSHLRNSCKPGNPFTGALFNIFIGLFSIIPVFALSIIIVSIQQYSNMKQHATREIYKYDFFIVTICTIILTLMFFSDSFKIFIFEYISLSISLAIMRGITTYFSLSVENKIHDYYMSFIKNN